MLLKGGSDHMKNLILELLYKRTECSFSLCVLHICMSVCVYVCMYMCLCIYIYIYIYINISYFVNDLDAESCEASGTAEEPLVSH
jgi:hypothetical protein